jgi:adenylate cyclase
VVEIERKFLVTKPPSLESREAHRFEQGYLTLMKAGAETRLRRSDLGRVLTVKWGTGRIRTENETEVDEQRFESLWRLTEGARLTKARFLIPHGELTIELDVYEGELDGLRVAEVEFLSEEAAEAFRPPEWFGEEVTGDQRYLNERLATEGWPDSGA